MQNLIYNSIGLASMFSVIVKNHSVEIRDNTNWNNILNASKEFKPQLEIDLVFLNSHLQLTINRHISHHTYIQQNFSEIGLNHVPEKLSALFSTCFSS